MTKDTKTESWEELVMRVRSRLRHERYDNQNPWTLDFAPSGGYILGMWWGIADEVGWEKN